MVSRSTGAPIDFAILTALEEERDAVLAKLRGARRLDKGEGEPVTVYAADVATRREDRAIYRVVVTCLGAQGPIEAAARAAWIAARFRPGSALFVGIAGGAPGVSGLGDVIVAREIADATVGKLDDQGRSIRWVNYPADAALLDGATALSTGWEDAITAARPAEGSPRRLVGVVVSGGDVIARADQMADYRARWPKLVGVEMEGGGAAAGFHAQAERTRFLMIRGVSDLADGAKYSEATKAWRPYACDVAAAYAIRFLESGPIPALDPARAIAAPSPVAAAPADARALLARLREGFTIPELEGLISDHFPEIEGGLAGIVSPVHDLRYQAQHVVDYFKRRRELARLAAAIDAERGA